MPRGVYERKPFTQEHRAALSKAKIGVPLSPEHCAAMSKSKKGVPKPTRTPEHCAALSKARKGIPRTSEAQLAADKTNGDRQRGGNDLVNHHWLYDDADLSLYTMPMTRSEHMSMHQRMRADGYKVQHINSATDDNGLWGYQ